MSKQKVTLTTPVDLKDLEQLKSGDQVLLSGIIYMARDAAHLRFHEALLAGKELPFDVKGQVIYYAGPTLAKPGHIIGPCGPTTASRMDPFTPALVERGLRATIGKGKRSPAVLNAMKKYGCVYFGAIEGTAVLISHRVLSSEVIAYPDLETEALRKLKVAEMPVTVINDL